MNKKNIIQPFKISDKAIIEAIEANDGNLQATYLQLKEAYPKKMSINFFGYVYANPKLKALIDSYRCKHLAEAEQKMFDLANSSTESVSFNASKFLLERLNRTEYAPPQAMQQITVEKDGKVDIKQIFGLE